MNEAQTGEKPLRKFTFRFVLDYIWLHLAHGIVFNDGIHHHTFISSFVFLLFYYLCEFDR